MKTWPSEDVLWDICHAIFSYTLSFNFCWPDCRCFSGAHPLWQCIWCHFFSETSFNFHSIWPRISMIFHLAVTWRAYVCIFQKFGSGVLNFYVWNDKNLDVINSTHITIKIQIRTPHTFFFHAYLEGVISLKSSVSVVNQFISCKSFLMIWLQRETKWRESWIIYLIQLYYPYLLSS